MTILRSVRTVARASGDGLIDWDAVANAAKQSTGPGDLDVSEAEAQGYATDVRDARDRLRELSGTEFDVPTTVEIQDRHHWIDANVETFTRVMAPLEDRVEVATPQLSRTLNTGSMSVSLGFLARNVLGQYDPLLLADAPSEDHGLYFVRPNIVETADDLDVEYDRFRRWIAFHEVTHAAEFGAAPWLSDHLADRMEAGIDALASGSIDRDSFQELQLAMTAVEGYAELLMDEAFDEEYDDLRQKLDERRGNRGPVAELLRRVLGFDMKRRQYERGKEFFEGVVAREGIDATHAVWDAPENLPTDDELDDPDAWIDRVHA